MSMTYQFCKDALSPRVVAPVLADPCHPAPDKWRGHDSRLRLETARAETIREMQDHWRPDSRDPS